MFQRNVSCACIHDIVLIHLSHTHNCKCTIVSLFKWFRLDRDIRQVNGGVSLNRDIIAK